MSFSQEHPHPQSLKRDHDQFLLEDIGEVSRPFTIDPKYQDVYQSPSRDETGKSKMENGAMSLPTPPTSIGTSKRGPSPARSSTGSLTDPRSATPSLPANSPDPKNSTVFRGPSAPPPKKAKLTLVEKEVMRINKEIKDQERSAEKARKESERLAHAQEKARKDAEKEAEKKKKEAEREEKKALQEAEKAVKEERRRKKEEEKQQKEQEKRQKEEEKRQKEEEKQRAEEEKRKKDRNQKKLNSYFVQRNSGADRTSMSPAPSNALLGPAIASPAAPSPRKSETSHYEQFFPAFFIQTNVTVAPINRFERDEDTSENQQRMLDSYIQQNRSPGHQLSFDAVSLFNLPRRTVRGRQCMTVREIMAEMSTGASCHIDLTTDSQDCQIKSTEDLLRSTPLKFLKFAEDVRPPYQGTYTSRPLHGMAKLARNPLRRDLPDTNYDYDSEAEWIEDEDAEDLHSEGEEDDAELDDAEDMDGFLDDENDELLTSKRLVLQGDLEPISTGLCWEDQPGKNINPRMMEYRMEAIHGMLLESSEVQKLLIR
jgi:chromatin assembly factor 1 subunit A